MLFMDAHIFRHSDKGASGISVRFFPRGKLRKLGDPSRRAPTVDGRAAGSVGGGGGSASTAEMI